MLPSIVPGKLVLRVITMSHCIIIHYQSQQTCDYVRKIPVLNSRTFITHISSKIQSFSNCTYSIAWTFMDWELVIMVFLTQLIQQPWFYCLHGDETIIPCYYLKFHVNAMITIFIYQSTIKTNTTAATMVPSQLSFIWSRMVQTHLVHNSHRL